MSSLLHTHDTTKPTKNTNERHCTTTTTNCKSQTDSKEGTTKQATLTKLEPKWLEPKSNLWIDFDCVWDLFWSFFSVMAARDQRDLWPWVWTFGWQLGYLFRAIYTRSLCSLLAYGSSGAEEHAGLAPIRERSQRPRTPKRNNVHTQIQITLNIYIYIYIYVYQTRSREVN